LRIKFVVNLTVCLVLTSAFSSLAVAQQTTPSSSDSSPAAQSQNPPQNPPADKPPAGSQDSADKSKDQNNPTPGAGQNAGNSTSGNGTSTNGTSNDRLFFALPNFLTLENAGKMPPLTTKEKFAVVARGSFDPVIFAWYGFLTGIGQAEDSEPGYGQGWLGFGKRYGANFADGSIENFMTGAIFPAVLKQDPRYFQMGHGGFGHRTLYAMSRNLITRTDSGKNQFNYSEVVGGALSAAISTYSYHPKGQYVTTTTPGVLKYIPSDRTLTNTAKVWGTQYGYDTLTLVVKEFWPDIRRALLHKKAAAPSVAPQSN
jgi:hypothetical protein